MQVLTWREVDFASVVLAGLIAGYVMAMVGLWAGSVPGLVAVDIADFGRRYVASDRPSAWLLGLGSHLVNSILPVLVWATAIEPNLAWSRPIEGLVWGGFLGLILAGALVAPMSGQGFMGRKTGSYRFALTSLLLHGPGFARGSWSGWCTCRDRSRSARPAADRSAARRRCRPRLQPRWPGVGRPVARSVCRGYPGALDLPRHDRRVRLAPDRPHASGLQLRAMGIPESDHP